MQAAKQLSLHFSGCNNKDYKKESQVTLCGVLKKLRGVCSLLYYILIK
jgi:hypothetical protein